MSITIYSLLMAILWFDLFILLGRFMRHKLDVFLNYNLYPLLFLVLLSVIRLFAPVETSFTIVLRSQKLFPVLRNTLTKEIGTVFGLPITFFAAIVSFASLLAIMLLARLIWKIRKDIRTVSRLRTLEDARIVQLMREVAAESGSRQRYRLAVSRVESTPLISGILRPTIVLPEKVLTLSDEELRFILRHEWQHCLNKDLLLRVCIDVLCCVMWWNPIVFLLRQDLEQTLELKCDVNLISRMTEVEKTDYLKLILKIVALFPEYYETQSLRTAIHFRGAAAKTQTQDEDNLEQRFHLILQHGARNRKLGVMLVLLLTTCFLLSFCFVIQPYYSAPTEDYFETPDDVVVQPTPENAFILEHSDGTRSLYIYGNYVRGLSAEELENKTHELLPVIKEKEE